MFSPQSLLASPSKAVFTHRAAPSHSPFGPLLGFPNEKCETNPFRIRRLLLSIFCIGLANPIVAHEPNPFSAAAASPGRRVIEPRGRRANAANLRVIISFSHHSVPEVKSTWH